MIQLKQNEDIQFPGFTLTKHGLDFSGEPSFKQWESVGRFISRSSEAVQFWRGDWLNFGEHNYSEWTQYFSEDQAAYGTLRNEKWVASRIPMSRRRDNLSWSHHYEVADLEPEDQEEMLNFAEKNKLPVSKFRKAVQHYKMKLDLPELNDEQLQPTDPKVFEEVQKIIDSSINTVEKLESLDWKLVHTDARAFLVQHLKRAMQYYLRIIEQYDKQKQISAGVVQNP